MNALAPHIVNGLSLGLLFALIAFGAIFGIIGVVLAAPLAVVTFVMVKRLYVIETLETSTPIPGADKK